MQYRVEEVKQVFDVGKQGQRNNKNKHRSIVRTLNFEDFLKEAEDKLNQEEKQSEYEESNFEEKYNNLYDIYSDNRIRHR